MYVRPCGITKCIILKGLNYLDWTLTDRRWAVNGIRNQLLQGGEVVVPFQGLLLDLHPRRWRRDETINFGCWGWWWGWLTLLCEFKQNGERCVGERCRVGCDSLFLRSTLVRVVVGARATWTPNCAKYGCWWCFIFWVPTVQCSIVSRGQSEKRSSNTKDEKKKSSFVFWDFSSAFSHDHPWWRLFQLKGSKWLVDLKHQAWHQSFNEIEHVWHETSLLSEPGLGQIF